ncbi:MAG: hypothetical protein JSR62_02150 [Nitrospira sp.]|nr:hypothetical protein [Nitrospira sp.]
MPVSHVVASSHRTEIAGRPHEETGLSVAVVRLLAVALEMSEGWSPAPPAAGLLIPFGYHDWPSVTSLVESRGGAQQLRCYVCPKALLTTDSESFPVGTVFVVESQPSPPRVGARGLRPSLFVMEKCAGMSLSGRGQRESWIYASWNSAGFPARAEPGRCGICRLPWLPSVHS